MLPRFSSTLKGGGRSGDPEVQWALLEASQQVWSENTANIMQVTVFMLPFCVCHCFAVGLSTPSTRRGLSHTRPRGGMTKVIMNTRTSYISECKFFQISVPTAA